MSNSSLINYTKISPNQNPRKNDTYNKTGNITKITIHHMAGNLSVETCGNVFQTGEASSNYGIGTDGRVGMYVEEDCRSWCSSSRSNDYQAVTIEVANDGGADTDWHVSDTALSKLIDLCVDICQRNGIKQLNYTGDTTGNLTRHNMFANTTCPGPYLQGKFSYIAEEVNKRLGVETGGNTDTAETPASSAKIDVTYRVKANGRWLPEVKNLEDYAGNIGQKITDLAVKVSKGSVKYRVHTGGRWLPWVTGYNINDFKNGYAGNGTPVDGVQIYFYTPDDVRPYQQAYYRVSEVKKDYFAWQEDTSTANGMDGYAGNANGKAIDRIQIQIKSR
jgi:hypothetical protein